jgi:hypothetical protein
MIERGACASLLFGGASNVGQELALATTLASRPVEPPHARASVAPNDKIEKRKIAKIEFSQITKTKKQKLGTPSSSISTGSTTPALGSAPDEASISVQSKLGVSRVYKHRSNDLPLGDVRQNRERNMNKAGQH